jgi:hypothetical protein
MPQAVYIMVYVKERKKNYSTMELHETWNMLKIRSRTQRFTDHLRTKYLKVVQFKDEFL